MAESASNRGENNLLHPLASIKWEHCHTWEGTVKPTHCAVLHDKVAILDNVVKYGRIHVSSTHLNSWTTSDPMYGFSSLITYQSQFVLVGGSHPSSNEPTNRLLTSTNGLDWKTTLPPMPTSRYATSLVSGGSPEILVVAGGKGSGDDLLDVVEVLLDDRWMVVDALPASCCYLLSTFHEGNFYFTGGDKDDLEDILYICSYDSLDRWVKHKMSSIRSLWQKRTTRDDIRAIATYSSNLICIDAECTIYCYSHSKQSWLETTSEGHVPQDDSPISFISTALLSSDQLVIANRFGVYRISSSVAAFDPDSQFISNVLPRLETVMGVEIESVIATKWRKFTGMSKANMRPQRMSRVSLLKPHTHPVQYMQDLMYLWYMGHSPRPPTWRELLQVLQEVGLMELRQQIEAFLKGEASYLEAYSHFIATKESLDMLFLKFLFVGPPRLGKTTLRRRLLKEIIDLISTGEADKSQPSTGAVESSDVVVTGVSTTTAVITESEWSALASLLDEARMLIHSLMDTVQPKPLESSNLSLHDSIGEHDSSSGAGSSLSETFIPSPPITQKTHTQQSEPVPSSDASSEHQKSQLPKKFANASNILREAMGSEHWKHVKHMFKAYMRMEDTGGQPELMDMLPALTLGPGLYLLFINLQNDLNHHYKLTYCNESGESTPPIESVYSVQEMLLSSLSSISCSNASSPSSELTTSSPYMGSLLESSKSVAYIVGTHKDKVSTERLKKLNEDLKRVIIPTQFYKQDIVQFASEEDLIVAIDNMAGGAEEIQKMKKLLEDSMARHFKKLKIPAVWLFFSLFLRHQNNTKMATLDYCMQLSNTLGMSVHETEVALWFLHHHAGVLMYFPNVPELKDLVIIDTQVVYDSVTKLILQAMSYDKVGHSAAKEFKKTGKFTKSHIIEATREVSGEHIAVDKLVALLEFLHIIARISCHPIPSIQSDKEEVAFMMPCVLRNATFEEIKFFTEKSENVPSIMFHFKCRCVPIGVFSALLACLISNSSFVVMQDKIYKNLVQFYFGDFYTLITLVCGQTCYECIITKFSKTKIQPHIECESIRREIESTLSTVSSRVNHGSFMDYEFAFDCPLHPDNGREHLCVVDRIRFSSGMMLCHYNSCCPVAVEIPSEAKVWFGEPLAAPSLVASDEISAPLSSFQSTKKPNLRSLISFKCTGGENINILNEIGVHYYDFGVLLLNDDNGKELDGLEHKHMKDPKPILREIIKLWLEGQGQPVSWQTLVSVLEDIGLKVLAERIQSDTL